MEENVANYYSQKRKKKKINKIKITFTILIILGMIVLGKQQILKSNSSYIDNSIKDIKETKDNINNEQTISVVIGKQNEETTETNQANNSTITNNTNNKSNVNNIEQKEKWKTVGNDYFKDAVFIGDSRTEGFILNNGLTAKITSYTHKGLTVDTIFTDKVIHKNGKKLTIIEALKETNFAKVYIMLGINETGWVYSDLFISKYVKIIDEIKKINPKCTIYIESIIPVTEQVSNEHRYLKNSKIKKYNSLIKKMAGEKNVYYLNVQEAVINLNGNLPEDAAIDGIHLNKKYCEKWFQYLKNHTR